MSGLTGVAAVRYLGVVTELQLDIPQISDTLSWYGPPVGLLSGRSSVVIPQNVLCSHLCSFHLLKGFEC